MRLGAVLTLTEQYLACGGWDTTATQSTVVTPAVVKQALIIIDKFASDFNSWLLSKGHVEQIKVGHPLGSSAYHDVDDADKVYGDIDLQIVVPNFNGTHSAMQAFWNKVQNEFVQSTNPRYVLVPESKPGHPIIQISPDKYVQVDLIWNATALADWGRYRTTPQRGLKGLLNGNMFSTLGDILDMSLQHSGVQFKVSAEGQPVPFSKQKGTTIVTVSTNPQTFLVDLLYFIAKQAGIERSSVVVDEQLKSHRGVNIENVQIQYLAQGIQGLAASFAQNRLYGKGMLAKFDSPANFISTFVNHYEQKVAVDLNGKKRDKASTPEAKARAEQDIASIQQGLDTVKSYFS